MARDWQNRANELAAQAYAAGEPTAWFDRLYAEGAAGTTAMPWDRGGPMPVLREWAETVGLRGEGRRAVVVGCGLGADPAYVAELGFSTAGFDLSPTAIAHARDRFPDSGVDFRAADLLDLPVEWRGAFDLVVEIFTLQAVSDPPRTEMAAGVRSLVAPGGTLLLVAFRYDGTTPPESGPPFPLNEDLVRGMATDGLELDDLQLLDGPLWRAVYRRRT